MHPDDGTQNHHYIPQWLLRGFREPCTGKIQVFFKETGAFRSLSTSNIFCKENLYRMIDPGSGCYHNAPERTISKIESETAPVIRTTIADIRRGKPIRLSTADKVKWLKCIANLWARNPTVMKENREVYESYAFRKFEDVGLPIPSRENLDREFNNKIRPQTAAGWYTNSWTRMIAGKGCIFLRIDQNLTDKQFVIGNRMLTTIGFAGTSIGLYPITYDISVLIAGTPQGEGVWGFAPAVNEQFVDLVNQSTFQQSRIIAGRSQSLLQTLRDIEAIPPNKSAALTIIWL